MPNFRATNQDTAEVVEYTADTPLAEHKTAPWWLEDVSEATPTPDIPPDTRVYSGRRRLSKLEFLGLLTDEEYAGILTAMKASVAIEAWVKKMELATPDADGTAIDLDDPRTQAGVQALEMIGLLAAGRAEEVLNG